MCLLLSMHSILKLKAFYINSPWPSFFLSFDQFAVLNLTYNLTVGVKVDFDVHLNEVLGDRNRGFDLQALWTVGMYGKQV